jgi:hypothetical protein
VLNPPARQIALEFQWENRRRMSDALNSRSWQRVQHRFPVLPDAPEVVAEAQSHIVNVAQRYYALSERISADPRLSEAGKREAQRELAATMRGELGQLDDVSSGIGRRFGEETARIATLTNQITNKAAGDPTRTPIVAAVLTRLHTSSRNEAIRMVGASIERLKADPSDQTSRDVLLAFKSMPDDPVRPMPADLAQSATEVLRQTAAPEEHARVAAWTRATSHVHGLRQNAEDALPPPVLERSA